LSLPSSILLPYFPRCSLNATKGISAHHLRSLMFHLCFYFLKLLRLRWAGHVARMGDRRGAYRALVGKPEGRRPLGRPRRRWEDNIKMDLREVGLGGVGIDWIDLAQDRDRRRALVYTVMNLRVP
jgi:hypothetical protein